MEDKLKPLIDDKIKSLDMHVDSIYQEVEDGNTYLRVVLDADYIIDINKITMASRMINPIIDECDLLEEQYILDVYAKSKGDIDNE